MERFTGKIKRAARRVRRIITEKGQGATARLMIAVLLASSTLGVFSPLAPTTAYAASNTITGTCYVECDDPGYLCGGTEDFTTFFVTMPDGKVYHGECLNHGDAIPLDGNYTFTGTWNGSSYDIVVNSRYTAYSTSELHPAQAAHYIGGWPTLTQRVGGFTYMPNGYLSITKTSANTTITDGNDCYSLEGAVFTVYDESGESVGELTTGANGKTNTIELPAGDYTIRETTAPEGYYTTSDKSVTIQAGKTATVSFSDNPASDPIGMLVGKYDGEKTYSGEANLPLGSASLANAEFTVEYYDTLDYDSYEELSDNGVEPTRSWVFSTDGDGFAYFSEEYLVSGDAFYYDTTGTATIPRGTIVIYEYKAPEGYLINDEVSFQKIQDNSTEGVITYNTVETPEQVYRSDFEFTKKADNSSASLSRVPFEITSVTTGESHIIVTDENGFFSSSSAWNAHTYNTNGNDWALDANGTIDSEQLDATAGVWFGDTTANDSLGALPYDTYTVKELRCTANEGYALVNTTITISRNGVTVDMGTLTDPEVEIGTTAMDAADGDHYIGVGTVTISDKVNYSHLVAGETYTITGQLYDAETGDAIKVDGEPVTASTTFVAEKSYGSATVEFTLDTYDLVGKTLVVFETLTDEGGSVLAEHKALDDTGQQVTVLTPEIETTAVDNNDSDKNVVTDTESTIVDTVSYRGLTAGETYTVTGTLMVKTTDEDGNVSETELLVNGEPVVAQAEFVAEASSGTVEVPFTFDSTGIESGTELVVFEKLYMGEHELAVHEDIEDEAQTVTVTRPELGTTATDGYDGDKNVVSDAETTVVDTVTYKNLVPGKEYTVKGTLHVKVTDDEGNVTEEALEVDGQPVTAETTFTPETADGTVDVTFIFDSSDIADGTELVAFESIERAGVELASHADIEDEAQTVTVHKTDIGTIASDGLDGDKSVVADAETAITDEVSYNDVLTGTEYTMAGILIDAETGLPILEDDADGQFTDEDVKGFMEELSTILGLDSENEEASIDVEALDALLSDNADLVSHLVFQSEVFTPENVSGSVSMDFNFDSNAVIDRLSGETKDIVVFEMLFKGSFDDEAETVPVIVATELDLENEDQTVTLIPSAIGTTATDASDGDHELMAGQDATITDTVTYEGLIPGKEYVLKATLYDKATGEPLSVNDKHVTAELRFTPNSESGSIDIDLGPFDATALNGHDLVVYEELYKQSSIDGKSTDILVAQHKDLNDKDQTVTVTSTPKGGFYGKTGGNDAGFQLAIILLIAAAAGLGLYGLKCRRAAKQEEADSDSAKNEDSGSEGSTSEA